MSPGQRFRDVPETLAYCHIIGEPGIRYLLAFEKILPTHALDLFDIISPRSSSARAVLRPINPKPPVIRIMAHSSKNHSKK
jgi:hypothetical protein